MTIGAILSKWERGEISEDVAIYRLYQQIELHATQIKRAMVTLDTIKRWKIKL